MLYTDATGSLAINMMNGTVSGAGVGSDSLISIEEIRGGNSDDNYNASTYNTGSVSYQNVDGRFNEFEGMGGNDTITGNGATRVSYLNATAGVTVTMSTTVAGSGTATGNSSVGTDTFTGVQGVRGSNFIDTISGSNNATGVENFEGRDGADIINGLGGFDRAIYTAETAGINVVLKTGLVTATSGNDTLTSIEAIRGSNFADTYTAVGFTVTNANGPNFGSSGGDSANNGFNEFEGMGGDDIINGNGNTRIAYYFATAAVTVNFANGTASAADGSVGNDTFAAMGTFVTVNGNQIPTTGVNAVAGSYFNDSLTGSNNGSINVELFDGRAGDDVINGAGGYDIAVYNNDSSITSGITATASASGWDVTGGGIGHDTLTHIESIRGTSLADTYNAGAPGFFNGSDLDAGVTATTFNEFEGFGGNDTITGNGNTRITFLNSFSGSGAGVTVTLTNGSPGSGTASGNGIGTDSFTGVNRVRGSNLNDTFISSDSAATEFFEGRNGSDTISYQNATSSVTVNLATTGATQNTGGGGIDQFQDQIENVTGSAFNDTLTGSGPSNILTGGLGADTLNGGTGTDISAYSGNRAAYTSISASSVAGGPDGGDSFTSIEIAQFADSYVLLNSGTTDVTGVTFQNGNTIFALGSTSETLIVGTNLGTRTIDLGGGNDTVTLGASGGGYQFGLANVENLTGTSGGDIYNPSTNLSGVTIDLGGGSDFINLKGGLNTVGLVGVEGIFATDLSGPASDDTLTLTNNISNATALTVNLFGGNNTLNLVAGANAFADILNVQHINGSGSNDTLTLTGNVFNPDNNPIVDLGFGDDTVNIGSQFESFSLLGVEHLNGNVLDNFFTLMTNVSGITVDLVSGNDTLVVANGINSLTALNIDQINGSDFSSSSNDTLTLLNAVSGMSVNLANGSNTLNLASGANTLGTVNNVQTVHGSATADALAITGSIFSTGTTIDLGSGTDSLTLSNPAFSITVVDIETVTGSASNDIIVIGNTSGATTVTGGLSADFLTASLGQDSFRFTNVADSAFGPSRESITNFNAADDKFVFEGMSGGPDGFRATLNFVEDGNFTGGGDNSEARLQNIGGVNVLQIDVNGDGLMNANDMEVQFNDLPSLHDNNFMLMA